jgi:hypothetical protein
MAKAKGSEKTGGRKKGTLNKATADLKVIASDYGYNALLEIVRLSTESENEQIRLSACKEILDRAYGKAPQYIENKTTVIQTEKSPLELARQVAFILNEAAESLH